MKKIALIPGHNERDRGAVSEHLGKESEFPLACKALMEMQERLEALGAEVRIFVRQHKHGGYTEQMRRVADDINAWGADFSFELHFNSFDKPTAGGAEMLHWHKSSKGAESAGKLLAVTTTALGVKARGCKAIKKNERGWGLLQMTRCPAVLAEPFFGSNPTDCEKWVAGRDAWIKAVAEKLVVL